MPEGASTLLFEHPSRRIRRRELRVFLEDLAARLAGARAVTCLITTDDRLHAMNRTFRGKDYATDMLSFPADRSLTVAAQNGRLAGPERGASNGRRGWNERGASMGAFQLPLGDLAISLDRAAEQAALLGHSVEEEVRILILHGMLHLAGLDHETDRGEMARTETRWRKRLGLPLGLIERVSA